MSRGLLKQIVNGDSERAGHGGKARPLRRGSTVLPVRHRGLINADQLRQRALTQPSLSAKLGDPGVYRAGLLFGHVC